MDDSPPDSPRPPPENVLATPESPPMSDSMVLREAQRIVQRLEELATTPLVDTRQITLVDFTLDSPELKAGSTPCRKLFQSPEKEDPKEADNSTENWLAFAEEHLGAVSLYKSTPLQLSPSVPAFEASFPVDTTDAPKDTPADEGKVAGSGELDPGVLATGAGDAPLSPSFATHGKAIEHFGALEGATAEVSADGAPQTSYSSAAGNEAIHLHVSYQEDDSPFHRFGNALPDDSILDSTPPLPALGESFVIARSATGASRGLPIADTTFTIPAVPSVKTATKQAPSVSTDATMIKAVNGSLRRPSSKRAPPVGKSLPSNIMDRSPPDSPHPPPGNGLATPESPPMSYSMVLREGQRIVQRLEELATTPLVDTRQITLVDFTLDSPELKAGSTPCRKLFQSPEKEAPKDADNSTENWLAFAEEHLGAVSLYTSTPLQLSPSVPAFEASFPVDTTDAPKDTPADEGKIAGPGELDPGVLASGAGDVPLSPSFATHGKAIDHFGAWKGATAEVSTDGAPQTSYSSAAGNEAIHLHVSYQEDDSPFHRFGNALPDDSILDSTPPLPALGESFAIARSAIVASRALPIADTTFTIPAVPSVKTATKQAPSVSTDATMIKAVNGSLRRPSSKRAPPVGKSLPSTSHAPVQRPAGRQSMAIKPMEVMVRPSSATTTAADTTFARDTQRPAGRRWLATKPRPVAVRPSAATETAADTKVAKEAPVRPSAARKGVETPQIGSTSGASKAARGMPSAPAVTKWPAARPTPAVPEPRRPLGPPAGPTVSSKRSIQPGARRSVAAVPRAAESQPLPAQPEEKSGRPACPAVQPSQLPRSRLKPPTTRGARWSVAAVPRASGSQPVPAQPKAKSALPAGPAVQPSQMPRSRLRPPTSRVSGSIPQVPRPAFSEARRLPPVPESQAAARLSSTPGRVHVPLGNDSPQLAPIRKQPGRH